jgi:hypothetical protein
MNKALDSTFAERTSRQRATMPEAGTVALDVAR